MTVEEENQALRIALVDMVGQHLLQRDGVYDANHTSTNRHALWLLIELGEMELVRHDGGRGVWVRAIPGKEPFTR